MQGKDRNDLNDDKKNKKTKFTNENENRLE
jgi:hypothetical protein